MEFKSVNKNWEYKNKILSSTAHLKINIPILEKDKWTLQDIENRTKKLIKDISRLYPYFDAKDTIIKKIPIYIEYLDIYAQAIYYPDNGSVEVEAGSTAIENGISDTIHTDAEMQRSELVEDGILVSHEGKLVFTKNHTFYSKMSGYTALSTAAGVILYGSRNGWDYWMTEDNKSIKFMPGIKKTKKQIA